MRKILILTQCFPPKFGGIERLMSGLAAAMAADGRDVTVLADGAPAPWDAEQPFEIQRYGGWKQLRQCRKGRAATHAARRADLVIADTWKSLEFVAMTNVSSPVHCLAMGMEFPAAPSPAKYRRMRLALAKANRVLAISAYTYRLTAPFLDAPDRLSIVTPPLEPQPEPSEAAAAKIKEFFPSETARPLVATLARLEARKGVDRLIEAMPALSRAHPRLTLAVAGDGPQRPELEHLAQHLGVAARVRFLGRVSEDEKAALLSGADLFAMPTRREGSSVEGFGLVYLEAGWHGTPSLAGEDGGAADAMRLGQTGDLCDGADPEAVKEALTRLLDDPERLKRMGAAAAEFARAQLWPRRVRDYLPEGLSGS